MAIPNIDKVEIVEPPIGELTKRGGSFKQGCFTGCLFFIILLIGIIVGIKLYVGKGPTTIKKLPDNFPVGIPLYAPDDVEQITFISGQYKSHGMRVAALLPRVIFSPLLSDASSTHKNGLVETWRLLASPVNEDNRNTVQVEWTNMDATTEFVLTYYMSELRKSGFEIQREAYSNELDFKKNNITGTLIVQGAAKDKTGTAYAILTVNY